MRIRLGLVLVGALTIGSLGALVLAPGTLSGAHAQPVEESLCYACHKEIQEMKVGTKHAGVNCGICHMGAAEHARNPTQKPLTKFEHITCGQCHRDQYESFVANNLQSKPKMEKATTTTDPRSSMHS